MRKYCALWVLLVGFFGLVGCAHHELPAYMNNPGIAHLSDYQKKQLYLIERSGIQVVKEGMVFHFYLSTDRFFEADSRKLKHGREHSLFELAKFLRNYAAYFSHPKISVVGYTDKVLFRRERRVLSMHYAQSVAAYLSQGGVPWDMLVVKGMGAKDQVGSNHYPEGAAYNRRVVITVK